jgi:salicylate hydroxylase
MDAEAVEEFKKTPMTQWGFGIGDLIKNAHGMVKVHVFVFCYTTITDSRTYQYGLYDRPELKSWHQGRVLLIGDAAHPTSPVSALPTSVQLSINISPVAPGSRRKPVYGRRGAAY